MTKELTQETIQTVVEPEIIATPEVAVEEDKMLAGLRATISTPRQASQWKRFTFYADQGVGKTTLAAGAPKPLIIDFDVSTESIQHMDHVKVMEYKGVKQLEVLAEKITEGHFKNDIETVIFDTATVLSEYTLDGVLQRASERDAEKNANLAGGPEYNENTEIVRRILDPFKRLPVHVIILAHVKEVTDKATGRIYIRPNLTPKLGMIVGRMSSIVGYMINQTDAEGKSNRLMQIQPTERIAAKNRIRGLPNVLTNPTIPELIEASRKNGEVVE